MRINAIIESSGTGCKDGRNKATTSDRAAKTPREFLSEHPDLDSNTRYESLAPDYTMLGYESRSHRFWVVTTDSCTESKPCLNKIIEDIYSKHQGSMSLDQGPWNISFFNSEQASGYKTFKPSEYLAEYWSDHPRHKKDRNKAILYPAFPKKKRWHQGPNLKQNDN